MAPALTQHRDDEVGRAADDLTLLGEIGRAGDEAVELEAVIDAVGIVAACLCQPGENVSALSSAALAPCAVESCVPSWPRYGLSPSNCAIMPETCTTLPTWR